MKLRQYFLLGIFLSSYVPILAQVDTAWVRHYDGPGNAGDVAYSVAVDDSGNVYVTGYSWGSGTEYDLTTIKYKPNGDTAWVRRYDGPGNSDDQAWALALDDSGNVYATGYSDRNISAAINQDYATVKYSADGTIKWITRYNGPGDMGDVAYALAVDDSGNVYVTGRSWGGSSNFDIATIKYIPLACIAKAGDANNDNQILLSDIVTTINFIFRFQPLPPPDCRADANADGKVLLTDVIYLINNIFKAGPLPVKNGQCCL